MAKEKKEFNYGLYAAAAIVSVVVVLVLITLFTFRGKYIAYDAEKVAVNYADTIAQKGDGYNAYKYTMVSKDSKYGDFIRVNYMYPLIYDDYTPGMNTKGSEGLNADSHKSETTINDDGSLAGKLADAMYPYYVELLDTVGWDDYNSFFKIYFSILVEQRKAIFGDDYLTDGIMFTALESNVATYGDSLTGTTAKTDENSGVTIGKDTTGAYQTAFGDDYKLTTTVKSSEKVTDLAAYKAALDADKLATYGVNADDIKDAAAVTVQVATADGTVVAEITVNEVKIGSAWYVDNLSTDTTAAYKIAA